LKNPALPSIIALNVQSKSICYHILSVNLIISSKRHFETDTALRSHWKGKVHKRRCKVLKEPVYTIEEAERAAGLGREGKRTPISAQAMPIDT
jgi:bud site selection protein 20